MKIGEFAKELGRTVKHGGSEGPEHEEESCDCQGSQRTDVVGAQKADRVQGPEKRIEVVFADLFFPSSKTCSNCGNINKDLQLKDRIYICPVCGHVIDRDLDASINLDDCWIHQHDLAQG